MLRRTVQPFYGQKESDMSVVAARVMRSGDRHTANEIFNEVEERMRKKREAHTETKWGFGYRAPRAGLRWAPGGKNEIPRKMKLGRGR